MKKLLSLSALLICANAIAKIPVSVQIGSTYNELLRSDMPVVYVYSEVDRITIHNITVNRGNCRVIRGGNLNNIPLSDGTMESLERIKAAVARNQSGVTTFGNNQIFYVPQCNLREIQVQTDQGNYSFSTK